MKAMNTFKVPKVSLQLVVDNPSNWTPQRMRSTQDLLSVLEPIRRAPQEHFVAILLNSLIEVVGYHEISRGSLTSSIVHCREVFKAAIMSNAYAIIVAHNHPSGEADASPEDLEVTMNLYAAGLILGIHVLDHVIITPKGESYSIRAGYPAIWTG